MAHVNSESFQDDDGIFLYEMEGKRRKRRIGGPYLSNRIADKASKAASEEIGEGSVGDYMKFLQKTNPGIIGGQSPIPVKPPTNDQFEAIFNRRAKEYREGLLDVDLPTDAKPVSGSPFSAISPAGAEYRAMKGSTFDPLLGGGSLPNYKALGIIPMEEYDSLLNTDFITDVKVPKRDLTIPIDTGWQSRAEGFPANMDEVEIVDTGIEEIIQNAADKAGVRAAYTDGFRTPEQNATAGGSKVSKHLTGNAFDLKLSGDYQKDWLYYTLLRDALSPLGYGVVFFPESDKNHIHIQKPRKGE